MRQFLKIVFGNLVAMGLFAFVIFLLFGAVITAIVVQEPPKTVPDQAVLVFDMTVNLTDSPPSSDLWDMVERSLGGSSISTESLRTVVDTLDRAAKDPKITALHLSGSFVSANYGSGFSALRELRLAVERFKESGKPVLAYLETPSPRDFYVASAADEIHLHPYGALPMAGLASQQIFLGGFLEKYGVGIQTTRAGRYKSAVEMFTEEQMSEANREQTEVLLNDFWQEILHTLESARGVDRAALQQVADTRGFFEPEEALQAGLVDAVSHFDEMLDATRARAGQSPNGPLVQVAFDIYAATEREKRTPRRRAARDLVAVVYVEGDIVDGEGMVGTAGGDRLAREIRRLRGNDRVKAMVVRVNSPGGSVSAAEIIRREVDLAAATMPVVVSFGSYAASGGYWISAGADRIFTQPTTITGSIGGFGLIPNFQELADRHKVRFDTVKTGEFADMFSVTRPKTEREMEVIQEVVDRIYGDFLTIVAEGRNLSVEAVDELGQGRVWSGREALRLGLADEFGGLREAIAHAAADAGLERWEVVEHPRRLEWAEALAEALGGEPVPPLLRQGPAGRLIGELHEEYRLLQSLNDPRGVYLRMPFSLKIQ